MSFALTPQAINAIRRNISASLTDTFQLMFQMDVFLMPEFRQAEDSQTVCAHMELTYKTTKACMTIAITRLLVEHISEQLLRDASARSPDVIQDIVCEITNIVGNHLRSYLSDKMGVEFIIGMPKPGLLKTQETPHMFNLHFRIRESDSIDLDFHYAA